MGILHCNDSLEEVELLYLTIILLMLLPSYKYVRHTTMYNATAMMRDTAERHTTQCGIR